MEQYHELYRLCMAGAALGLLLSGVLFVRLDIRTAVRVLSGGRLRQETQKEIRKEKKKRIKKKKKRTAVKGDHEEQTALMKSDNGGLRVLEEILVVHTEEGIEVRRKE